MQHKPTVLPKKIDIQYFSHHRGFTSEIREIILAERYNNLIDFLSTQEEESGQVYTEPDQKTEKVDSSSPQEKGWEVLYVRNCRYFQNQSELVVSLENVKKILTTQREKVREWAIERNQVDANNDFELGRSSTLSDLVDFLDHMEG